MNQNPSPKSLLTTSYTIGTDPLTKTIHADVQTIGYPPVRVYRDDVDTLNRKVTQMSLERYLWDSRYPIWIYRNGVVLMRNNLAKSIEQASLCRGIPSGKISRIDCDLVMVEIR